MPAQGPADCNARLTTGDAPCPALATPAGGDGITTGPFVTIPWALIALVVVGLPLLAAAVVGLTARSKLPMVARID